MTTVNISTTKNKVEVVDAVQNIVEVDASTNNVVEVGVTGPQGPAFDINLNHQDKVNNSIMYYDGSSDTLKLDGTRTIENLVDGGNF